MNFGNNFPSNTKQCISIILTQNEGNFFNKRRLTQWMIIHRIMHAITLTRI